MKFTLSVLTLLLLLPAASAQTLGPDGFYYFSGYPEPYTRTWIAASTYYSGGRCFTQPGYYSYSRHYPPAVNLLHAPDFEGEVLKIVKAREEKAYRLKVLQSLGVSATGLSYLQSITQTGATLYGYPSVNGYAKHDAAIDVNALLLQNSQAVQASIQLGTQATSGLQQITQQVAADKAANEAAAARYAAAIKLIDGPPVLRTEQRKYEFAPPPPAIPENALPLKPGLQGSLQRLQTFFAASCAACHGADKQDGGLDLRQWPTFSEQQKAKVLIRISLPPEDAKFMPRLVSDPSKPGHPARREEKQAVLEN